SSRLHAIGPALLGAALLGAALLGGCVAPPAAAPPGDRLPPGESNPAPVVAWEVATTGCGASASMPAPVREERTQEGPTLARVAWSRDADRSRYEIACFDLPEPLGPEEHDALLARIERLIRLRPGARAERRRTRVAGLPAVELDVTLPGHEVGRYWLFLANDQRLFEVSVVGPAGERLTAGTAVFFGSFRLTAGDQNR
ncbi:MAG TPA: hypothetical protein VLS89_14170, partial [Candidatus Nanopelagicales bacterium]|nr:hypothetical protein [Candidatus Nanopelagicales bacterium]